MLQIRREQWLVLGRDAERRFIDRLCRELALHFAHAVPEPAAPAWRAEVEAGVARARLLGLHNRADLYRYVALCVACRSGFPDAPEHAWLLRILTDPRVPDPAQRLQRAYTAIEARAEEAQTRREVIAENLAAADLEDD